MYDNPISPEVERAYRQLLGVLATNGYADVIAKILFAANSAIGEGDSGISIEYDGINDAHVQIDVNDRDFTFTVGKLGPFVVSKMWALERSQDSKQE